METLYRLQIIWQQNFGYIKLSCSHHTTEFIPHHTSWFNLITWSDSSYHLTFDQTHKVSFPVFTSGREDFSSSTSGFSWWHQKLRNLISKGVPSRTLKNFWDSTSFKTRIMHIQGSLVVENHLVWWLLRYRQIRVSIPWSAPNASILDNLSSIPVIACKMYCMSLAFSSIWPAWSRECL